MMTLVYEQCDNPTILHATTTNLLVDLFPRKTSVLSACSI